MKHGKLKFKSLSLYDLYNYEQILLGRKHIGKIAKGSASGKWRVFLHCREKSIGPKFESPDDAKKWFTEKLEQILEQFSVKL